MSWRAAMHSLKPYLPPQGNTSDLSLLLHIHFKVVLLYCYALFSKQFLQRSLIIYSLYQQLVRTLDRLGYYSFLP